MGGVKQASPSSSSSSSSLSWSSFAPSLSLLNSSQALMLLVHRLGSLISYYPPVIPESILSSPLPPQSRQSPSHLPLCFWKSCTPHSFLLSPIVLLTGCHVRQPSPRQCLAFLSPLTAAAVKPLGFCTDRNLRVGVKTGAADVCLPHAPVRLIPTRQQGCFFFPFHSRTAEQMR